MMKNLETLDQYANAKTEVKKIQEHESVDLTRYNLIFKRLTFCDLSVLERILVVDKILAKEIHFHGYNLVSVHSVYLDLVGHHGVGEEKYSLDHCASVGSLVGNVFVTLVHGQVLQKTYSKDLHLLQKVTWNSSLRSVGGEVKS